MGCSDSKAQTTGPRFHDKPSIREEMERNSLTFKSDFLKTYTLGAKLGQGQFGAVYDCRRADGSGPVMAAKLIEKESLEVEEDIIDLISEISVMKSLKHKNIVRLYDVYESDTTIYIVEEIVKGGELFDRIVDKGAYTEALARDYIRGLVLAINHCHTNSIVHRDLKPENILMTNHSDTADFKICDFGFAKRLNAFGKLSTQCGTPGYMAPEIVNGAAAYGPEVDCWSLGVIFFIMLSGGPPFYEAEGMTAEERVLSGRFDFEAEEWDYVSDDAKAFIRSILVVNPAERMTCTDMLKHRWLTSSAVSSAPLPNTLTALKAFNAKRKLKAGMKTVVAGVRLANLVASARVAGAGAGAGAGAKGDGERKAEHV